MVIVDAKGEAVFSWRTVYVPQCLVCSTPVLDGDGRELVVAGKNLDTATRDRLAGEGWQVERGRRSPGRFGELLPDRLTCAACAAAFQARQQARDEQLHAPPVKEIDMSDRLGPGWTLRQREGDADLRRWLVTHEGTVRGIVQRYRRTSDNQWSRGWEASRVTATSSVHVYATHAAAASDHSSYLWRSRDLAAWGIATAPKSKTPNPAWATRRRPA